MLLEPGLRALPFAAQSILRGGYLAVQTFFLLSGFVLALSYASTRWNRHGLMRFAVARFARIYPAYLLSLVLISWFAVEFMLKPGRTIAQKAIVLGDYALLLQGWTGSLKAKGGTLPPGRSPASSFFTCVSPCCFCGCGAAAWPALSSLSPARW